MCTSVYGGYNSWWGFDSIFSSFGAYPGSWLEKDGKAVYGSTLPEVKDALSLMARWYREGILVRNSPSAPTANARHCWPPTVWACISACGGRQTAWRMPP